MGIKSYVAFYLHHSLRNETHINLNTVWRKQRFLGAIAWVGNYTSYRALVGPELWLLRELKLTRVQELVLPLHQVITCVT